MTDTHVFATDASESTVWDTDGNIVWGPSQSPGPDPSDGPYPETEDPMLLRLRPPTEALQGVYVVDPSTPGRYQNFADAFSAINGARTARHITGAGPQDFALVLVAPGEYRERLRPPDWTAIVSTTGSPDDVRVWANFDDGVMSPTFAPTGACYVEGIHFDGIASYQGDPGAGNAPATIWLVNGAMGASVTLANVRSTSNNSWLNTGAWQCGDLGSVMAYKCRFEMSAGSQPVNAQTSQAWRSMNPDHRADYIHVDCEASCPEGLVVGLADLRYGAHDRFVWTGGAIRQAPGNTAQFFHAAFLEQWQGPHNCETWCTPQVTYAGDGIKHYWAEPDDLADSIPVGGVAPGARAYYYPQALDVVGTLSTGTPDTTMTMTPDRWYFVPLDVHEARTLAGFTVRFVSGSGNVSVGLWDGALRDSRFHDPARLLRPARWRAQNITAPVTAGDVHLGRGLAGNTRLYPGPQSWVGIKVDSECVIAASSTRATTGLVGYQDLATFPSTPQLTIIDSGPAPAPVVKTGII